MVPWTGLEPVWSSPIDPKTTDIKDNDARKVAYSITEISFQITC